MTKEIPTVLSLGVKHVSIGFIWTSYITLQNMQGGCSTGDGCIALNARKIIIKYRIL